MIDYNILNKLKKYGYTITKYQKLVEPFVYRDNQWVNQGVQKINDEVLYKLSGPKDESSLVSEYMLNELARTVLKSEIKYEKKG